MKKTEIDIKTGIHVSLSIELKGGDGNVTNILSLASVVEEVFDDGCLLIYMPLHHGYHYPLPKKISFSMHFTVETTMYVLPVQFLEQVTRDNLVFAKLRRRGAIKPGQRRDCYRLSYSLPLTIEWPGADEKIPPIVGQMIDFSDGGMRFNSDVEIETNRKLKLSFDIGQVETVNCVVLRTERIENGNNRYRTAVQFRYKDKAQKRRFYKFIVEKQTEERKRQTQGFMPVRVGNTAVTGAH